MVNVAKISPHHKAFFPRVMRAAMLVQDYERVAKCAELYDHTFGTQVTNTLLAAATTALLFRGEHEAAWNLALNGHEDRDLAHPPLGVVMSITSILQYLKVHRELSVTREFLAALKAKKALHMLKQRQRRILIDGVVMDTKNMSDVAILAMLSEYAVPFSVRTSPESLADFAKACVAADRWSLLLQVLRARDGRRIPTIPGWLALRIRECAMEDASSVERMELVTEMTRVVDFAALNEIEHETLHTNGVRALQTLGRA